MTDNEFNREFLALCGDYWAAMDAFRAAHGRMIRARDHLQRGGALYLQERLIDGDEAATAIRVFTEAGPIVSAGSARLTDAYRHLTAILAAAGFQPTDIPSAPRDDEEPYPHLETVTAGFNRARTLARKAAEHARTLSDIPVSAVLLSALEAAEEALANVKDPIFPRR